MGRSRNTPHLPSPMDSALRICASANGPRIKPTMTGAVGKSKRRISTPIPTPWGEVPWLSVLGAAALTAVLGWLVAHFVVGTVIPYGALSLLAIGAAAAPALLLYLGHTIGWNRLRGFAAKIAVRRR